MCVQCVHVCAVCVCSVCSICMCNVQHVCECVQYACVQCLCVCVHTRASHTLQNMVVFLGVDAGNNTVRCRVKHLSGWSSRGMAGPMGADGAAPWDPGQLTSVGVGTWWKWQRWSQFSVTPGGAVHMLSAKQQVASHQLSSGTEFMGSFPIPPGCSPSGHRQGPSPASAGAGEGDDCSGCGVPRKKKIKSQPCPRPAGSQITWLCPQQDTELLASGFLSVKKTLNSVF